MRSLLPSRKNRFHDCRVLVLDFAHMLRRPLEAEAACHRLADCEMRLEPDPHRDVELVVARLRDGFVQGEIFLSTEIVALETLLDRKSVV